MPYMNFINATEVQRLPQGSPNYELVRQRLRRTRKSREMTLRDVAEDTKVSPATLSRFEKGVGNPDYPTLTALAQWLELDHSAVFKASEEEPTTTPEAVEAHLRADKNLDPKMARMLATSFRQLYEVAINDPETRVPRGTRRR